MTAETPATSAGLSYVEYRPAKRRLPLSEVWSTWQVTRMVAARDIRVKYKQAALGPLWLLIGPLGMLIAVTIAFSGVTDVHTGDVPYILFALTGLTCWTFVQLSLMISPQSLINNASLVRRSTCPRLALVQGALIANLPPVAVMLAITLVSLLFARGYSLHVLLLPVMVVWLFALAWGLSLLLAAVAARARDAISLVPLVVQAGLFVTPVGYPITGAPSNIQKMLVFNPVSGVIEGWRWCLLGMEPNMLAIGVSLALTVALSVAGWVVFTRADVRLADYV